MKEKNIIIVFLTMAVYGGISLLPLLNQSGGGDIAAIGVFIVFGILHFLTLGIILAIYYFRKQPFREVRIQFLTMSTLIGIILTFSLIMGGINYLSLSDKEKNERNNLKDSPIGYLCDNGKIRFDDSDCIFEDAQVFEEDTITCVKLKNKWGFINRKIQTVIPFQYDGAEKFSDGLAGVKKDSLWGFIDLKGRWAISPKYTTIVKSFENNTATVKMKDQTFIIDKKGNKL